jgi:hypothetical protein
MSSGRVWDSPFGHKGVQQYSLYET